MLEQFLKQPGFIYDINGTYYYLGKWICKECTDVNESDCVVMYNMCRDNGEDANTNLYFKKIRAHADFALEVPYNPVKIREDMSSILSSLSENASLSLEKQLTNFTEDLAKYCG